MLTGGCFCGHVRYEAGGKPFHPTICHCAMCRRVAGAPMVAWFSVPRTEYRVIAGEPTRFASSDRAMRSFCPPLTFEAHYAPAEIDITIMSLDDPEAMPPRDHSHGAARLSWVRLADGLPVFRVSRADP